MSAEAAAQHHGEIIIVRRGGDHEDGHHGGAWKIAFADFMTAMMCFFLVMWLINAANEQTKASVASYFNPVKLIDRNSSRKGIEDVGDGPNSTGTAAKKPDDESQSGAEGEAKDGETTPADEAEDAAPKTSDDQLFADPYAVLAEIVEDAGIDQNVSEKGEGGASDSGPSTGASGGEAYRDPFAPDFWSQQVAAPDAPEQSAERSRTGEGGDRDEPAGVPATAPEDVLSEPKPQPAPPEDPSPVPELPTQVEIAVVSREPAPQPTAPPPAADPPLPAPPPAAAGPSADAAGPRTPSDAAKAAAAAIRKELAEAFRPGEPLQNGLAVAATAEGVEISVTEELDFGMFEVGSAVPRRDLVLAMEKIGRVLDSHPGTVSVSGHTDARPFRGKTYDNWRLSSARAQSAYYMLVRGGLDEKRVKEIGGFADRALKVAADPMSAANRRIEIRLRVDG